MEDDVDVCWVDVTTVVVVDAVVVFAHVVCNVVVVVVAVTLGIVEVVVVVVFAGGHRTVAVRVWCCRFVRLRDRLCDAEGERS